MPLLIATTNPHKLREIRQILDGLPIPLFGLTDLPAVPEHEETGTTFAENARQKARFYARTSGLPTVAEDSGLEVDALDLAPGVYSSRYHGATYPEKFAHLYAQLRARGADGSTARFVCALALVSGDRVIFETVGTAEGRLAPAARGAHGFGYDPIFFYPPAGRTFGELTDEEKRAVSHRGAAFRSLRAYLEAAGLPERWRPVAHGRPGTR